MQPKISIERYLKLSKRNLENVFFVFELITKINNHK
jgi:hypothetical protein